MLQLYIDGQRVNLSEGVTTNFYRRNPFFTNDGDYTLDIDIDLGDPDNAQVYHHAYRLDRVRRSSRRTAVLMDETTVLMKGTEVVLDMHEGKAKIQIVGGVSALNNAMSDRRLRELDLYHGFDQGESTIFPVCAYNISEHADFGLIDSERMVTEDGATVMKWAVVNGINRRVSPSGVLPLLSEVRQPYMWALFEHVITALGFGIGTNVLHTDERYSKVVMVHAIRTGYIAEMLPDWTVTQFFDEIQKFFNVILTVDATTNEVSLIHAWDYFSQGMIEIPHGDIISIKKDFDQKSDMTMVDYTAVHYALTDKMANKYAAIPKSLTKMATKVPAQLVSGGRTYDANYYAGIWKAITNGESFLSQTSIPSDVSLAIADRKIYTQTINGEERQFVLWAAEDNYCALKMVNAFSAKESDRSDVTDVELKIVPARMVSSHEVGTDEWFQYPMPAVDDEASSYFGGKFSGGITPEDEDNESGFNDEIKAGESKTSDRNQVNRADVMFVALYFGLVDIDWEDPDNNYPSGKKIALASPDWQVQLHRLRGAPGSSHFWKSSRQVHLGSVPMSLAINGTTGMDAYSYSRNPTFDTSVGYTIKFRSVIVPDVRQIFLIENRKFYCKELKYDISANRRSEIVEGVFIPVVESSNSSESGESIFYVTYELNRVILEHRVMSVNKGEPLDLTLKPSSGGNASWVMTAQVIMGGVDITASAFTRNGRQGSIHIGAVTGDVKIMAEMAVPTTAYITMNVTHITHDAPASVPINGPLTVNLTAESGYAISTVAVTMGGVDVTASVYSNGVINIASATGDVVVTAVAVEVIVFEDANVKAICVNNWGGNVISGEITPAEAAAVTTLSNKFYGNTSITKFNELRYFTGLTTLYYNSVSSYSAGAFYNCSALTEITMPAAPITNLNGAFRGSAIKEIDLTPITATSVSMSTTFRDSKVEVVTLDAIQYTGNLYFTFRFANSTAALLHTIHANGASFSGATLQSNTFANCYKLQTIDGTITGLKQNLTMSQSSKLTRASLLVIINGLYDFIGAGSSTRRTLTLHATAYARLTADDIAIAEAKGWTVASA